MAQLVTAEHETDIGRENWNSVNRPMVMPVVKSGDAATTAPLGNAVITIQSLLYPQSMIGDHHLLHTLYQHASDVIQRTERPISHASMISNVHTPQHVGTATTEHRVVFKMSTMVEALCDTTNDLAGLDGETGFALESPELVAGVRSDLAFRTEDERELLNFEAKKAGWVRRVQAWAEDPDVGIFTDEGARMRWDPTQNAVPEWTIFFKVRSAPFACSCS